jgi:hypothetical protein
MRQMRCVPVSNVTSTTARPSPEVEEAGRKEIPDRALLPPEERDSLVALIALYPDPRLAQVLAAFHLFRGSEKGNSI